MRKLILASASPWRKILLKRAGFTCKVVVSGHPENLRQKLAPKALAKKLALEKARAVRKKEPDAIILAADTVVLFKGKVIGKPRNNAEAKRILRALSGRQHSLITGFAILDSKSGKSFSGVDETRVWFRTLTKREIDAYVRTGEPLTVAGAYGIQGGGASFAHRIEGDFYTVVGLPLARVVEVLRTFGLLTSVLPRSTLGRRF